jgi:predicted nucleotidyltransferase
MIDRSAAARTTRLRRNAAAEIARHRDGPGFLGVALEGSLAAGAVWPTSDLDFTIVPRPAHSTERLVEWEREEALPFVKAHADQRIHIDVCGERDGIPWHKHLTDARALRDLLEGYPESFIRPAEGPFNPGAHWFLDGLAVMEVVEDPESLLVETRLFVAAHRFAPEVWEGRRFALVQELRRKLNTAHDALERGEVDEAHQLLSGDAGLAAVAAQLWLEGAQRITSGKEQDGRLAAVTAALGCPEAHALYRRTLAVDPERARAVVPLLRDLGERGAALYHRLGAAPLEDAARRRETRVWAAYLAHVTGTLSLAPGHGHPVHVYQSLDALAYWAEAYPKRVLKALRADDAPGLELLHRQAAEVAGLEAQIRARLLDPALAIDRARDCLAAADQLVSLTEARL